MLENIRMKHLLLFAKHVLEENILLVVLLLALHAVLVISHHLHSQLAQLVPLENTVQLLVTLFAQIVLLGNIKALLVHLFAQVVQLTLITPQLDLLCAIRV